MDIQGIEEIFEEERSSVYEILKNPKQQNERGYKRYVNKLNHFIRIAKAKNDANNVQHGIQSMNYLAERNLVTCYEIFFK